MHSRTRFGYLLKLVDHPVHHLPASYPRRPEIGGTRQPGAPPRSGGVRGSRLGGGLLLIAGEQGKLDVNAVGGDEDLRGVVDRRVDVPALGARTMVRTAPR